MPIETKPPARKSWRDVLPIHPAANRIPNATEEEKHTLASDLRCHGQRMPVILVRVASRPNARPELLDGRTRLDLQEANGVEVIDSDGGLLVLHRVVQVQDDAEAEKLSLSLNVHRRHLPAEERRKLIAAEIKVDPSRSDRQIAETVKVSPTTVGTVRAELEAKGDVSKLDTRQDTKGRKQPSRKPSGLDRRAAEMHAHLAQRLAEHNGRENERLTVENLTLKAKVEKLEHKARLDERMITGLRSELAQTKEELAKANAELDEIVVAQANDDVPPPAVDDGLDIPDYLDRRPKTAAAV